MLENKNVMNRRSFFRSLALLSSAAVAAPNIFLPKFEPVRWRILQAKTLVVNLEWLDARYEFVEQFSPPPVGPMVCTLQAMRPVGLEAYLRSVSPLVRELTSNPGLRDATQEALRRFRLPCRDAQSEQQLLQAAVPVKFL